MSAPTVDAIIVNYNTRDRTLEAIDSLVGLGLDWLGVVLIDNGSTDGSLEAIRAAHPEVTLIDAGENLGFARAVNRGVEESSADYVMLFNPDASAFPGSIEALVAFAEAHPEHGIYGGRTVDENGTLDPSSCWGAPSLWSLLCYATGASAVAKKSALFDPESLGRWQRDTVREVPIVTGCLLLSRRDVWHRIGGMDERFFLYGEDAEFSTRAWRRGFRPVIVPDAVIRHDVGGSSSSSGRRLAMVLAGKVTYFTTVWSAPIALIAVLLLQAGVALRAVLEGLRRSSRDAYRQAWAHRRSWRRGFPAAERTLFGREPSTTARHPLVVQAEPAFRTERANPYTADLYRAIQRRGATVRDLHYGRLLIERTDVIHLHWPDLSFLSGPRLYRHVCRLALFYGSLALSRRRGTVLVWTVHNVAAHEERSTARLRALNDRLLLKNVDGIISLTEQGITSARTAYPELADVPAEVIPHGHYRDSYAFGIGRTEARVRLGLDPDRPVIASVGQIRRYKNVPHLIRTFRESGVDATLLIAGKISPPELEAEIREAARGDDRIVIDARFLPDDDIVAALAAADLVILPYARIQNSGSAILAVSADRPVLVPQLGAMRELQEQLGDEWVRLFEGDLTADELTRALEWSVASGRSERADLRPLAWDAIAAQTIAAYRKILARARG